MRAFVVLAFVALAYGRPEPPVSYRYSAPSTSYGAPSFGGHGVSLGGHSSSSFGISGQSSGISFGSSGSGSSVSFGGDSGFASGYAGGYAGAPLVQKHIYVHVPPPEPQEQRAPRIPAVAPPQKHYKIIFIKAPTPPTPVAPVIPVQAQNEEKTLVYVLVKKPEDQPDIVIPTPAPTQPSKPEVYFIKYQTQKESGGAVSAGEISGGAASLSAGGVEVGAEFGGSGSEISVSAGGHSGATSTQYGPPGHVAGPLH